MSSDTTDPKGSKVQRSRNRVAKKPTERLRVFRASIPESTFKKLRIARAQLDVPMSQILVDLIEKYIHLLTSVDPT